MTHWFTQSWIWCWGTARATNNVGTSENTRCHRKCELLNLWWKVSLAHVWGREHTEVYLEILFGDVKWDNEIWDVHKTVCILDRFLSPMRSSPAISLSLSHTHTHTVTLTFTTHFLWTCHWCDPTPREVSFGPGTSVVSLSDFWKNRHHLGRPVSEKPQGCEDHS